MATSSIHEMLSTELTKLALLDIDKTKFTNWKEEKTHKTMLPGTAPCPREYHVSSMSKLFDTLVVHNSQNSFFQY